MSRRRLGRRPGREHIGIIVQNLPVPLDRRVWNECRALVEQGYRVSVICPSGPDDPPFEERDGVRIHKYPPPTPRDGHAAFVYESLYCWIQTARRVHRIHRLEPLDAVQACNPPDTFWALAAILKPLGVRFVFDHHDLCPEIYRSRFGREGGRALALLLWLERATFATADHVISTNESYREVALTRGRRRLDETTVVRSGPDADLLRPLDAEDRPATDDDLLHWCCYVGVMGHQDGVDVIVRAADLIVHQWGRRDIRFELMGFGDCLDDLRRLTSDLELDGYVSFPGRVDSTELRARLSRATVGLCPDPPSPFNDVSTMNKTLEYMACGVPVVAYDLRETRVSAGDAAWYAPGDDIESFAKTLVSLIDEPEERHEMGRLGRDAIRERLGWHTQAPVYVGVYERLFGRVPAADGVPA